jgi:hypothetical protein
VVHVTQQITAFNLEHTSSIPIAIQSPIALPTPPVYSKAVDVTYSLSAIHKTQMAFLLYANQETFVLTRKTPVSHFYPSTVLASSTVTTNVSPLLISPNSPMIQEWA